MDSTRPLVLNMLLPMFYMFFPTIYTLLNKGTSLQLLEIVRPKGI